MALVSKPSGARIVAWAGYPPKYTEEANSGDTLTSNP